MTRSQGPSQGPSATASTSATGGADGWEWPPRPWLEEPPALDESPRTRQGSFMFLWAQQDIHTALLAVLWTRSTGLGSAAAGGLESATIRRAWVSGDPAGLSQRRAGGMISRKRRAWVSRGRRRRSPANGGLGEPRTAAWSPAIGGHEGSRPADSPNSHADLTRARAEGRVAISLPRDKQKQEQTKVFQKQNTKRGEGAPLTFWSGLLSRCTQQGETRNTQTRINSNNSL